MQNTAVYQQYWGTVVDLVMVVRLYKVVDSVAAVCDDNIVINELEDFIRDQHFPDIVNRARRAYYTCDQFPRLSFGMLGEEIDFFFHELIVHPEYLEGLYHEAIKCSGLAAPARPLYIVINEIREQAK